VCAVGDSHETPRSMCSLSLQIEGGASRILRTLALPVEAASAPPPAPGIYQSLTLQYFLSFSISIVDPSLFVYITLTSLLSSQTLHLPLPHRIHAVRHQTSLNTSLCLSSKTHSGSLLPTISHANPTICLESPLPTPPASTLLH
jgi:hypothetical protein